MINHVFMILMPWEKGKKKKKKGKGNGVLRVRDQFKVGVSQGLIGWFWVKTWRKWGRKTYGSVGKQQAFGYREIESMKSLKGEHSCYIWRTTRLEQSERGRK